MAEGNASHIVGSGIHQEVMIYLENRKWSTLGGIGVRSPEPRNHIIVMATVLGSASSRESWADP